jgi:hypothetical protein
MFPFPCEFPKLLTEFFKFFITEINQSVNQDWMKDEFQAKGYGLGEREIDQSLLLCLYRLNYASIVFLYAQIVLSQSHILMTWIHLNP